MPSLARTIFDSEADHPTPVGVEFRSCEDTPGHRSTRSGAVLGSVMDQCKAVLEELDARYRVEANPSFILKAYEKVATEEDINTLLENSEHYRCGRWTKLVGITAGNNEFYQAYKDIIEGILKTSKPRLDTVEGGRRRVFVTAHTRPPHSDPFAARQWSSPDITITGDSPFLIHTDREPAFASYDRALFMVEGKVLNTERSLISEDDQIGQIGVHCRQILNHQPNRLFSRGLIVTPTQFRFFHFDRSGVQYTPFIDVHEEAALFVRAVLGLSSTDPKVAGFDPNIYWEGRDAKRIGYIAAEDSSKNVVACRIVEGGSCYARRSIRGRGTTCWPILDKYGVHLMMKNSWRSLHRSNGEREFLEAAKNVVGVGRMVSYQEYDKLSAFRGGAADDIENFPDRIQVHIILEEYGPSVDNFTSKRGLLCAFVDAINGHLHLYKLGILHRDVSVHNILLGRAGSPLGWGGVLIDLDMAMVVNKVTCLT